MTEVRVREFDELEWIAAVKDHARIRHLVKLDGKDVGGVGELLDGEIDRQRMAQTLPFARWRLGLAQVFRRDVIQRDEQVVIRTQFDVIAGCGRTIQYDGREIVS